MKINEQKLEKRRPKLLMDYFFKKKNKLTIVFIILTLIAIVAAALTLKHINYHILCGAIAIVFFVLTLLSALGAFSSRIKDREVEAIIDLDRKAAYEDVFKNLAINNRKGDFVSAPIEIITPELFPGRDTIVYRYAKKADKVYYSQTGYTWLLFGKTTLFHYHVSVNHIYGLIGYEEAQEISYKDIVSIKTVVSKEAHSERLELVLGLANGEKVNFVLRHRPNSSDKTSRISDNEASLIANIRKTIRENK